MGMIIEHFNQKDLERLARIQFLKVTMVLCNRNNILSFVDKTGQRVTADKPWFGVALAELGENGLFKAEPICSYYYGFAGEIHFSINTRHHERICHLPAEQSLPLGQSPPKEGDLLMGEVEDAPNGGKRFVWWMPAMEQDRRFAGVVLRTISYTPRKLESKLAITVGRRTNKYLVEMAQEYLQQSRVP